MLNIQNRCYSFKEFNFLVVTIIESNNQKFTKSCDVIIKRPQGSKRDSTNRFFHSHFKLMVIRHTKEGH